MDIEPKLLEKLAPFTQELINHFGYEMQIPSRTIAKELGNISFITAIKYINLLEAQGCLTIARPSRKQGNIYKLKKGKVKSLIALYNANIELKKIVF